MPVTVLWLHARLASHHVRDHGRRRLAGDRGEGVISAAIAVLIIAFLGAAMWLGFQRMWQDTEARTNDQVERIGSGG
ncbi:MAG: hypothetical protein MUF83_04615 [Acidimicrobiales bacterium]|jgi:hypothetical protein|nr:hypothetical protein [Acidimicrobiales bacterium]